MLAARERQELILSRYSVGESHRLSNVRFRTRVWRTPVARRHVDLAPNRRRVAGSWTR